MVIEETAFNVKHTFLPEEHKEFDENVGKALLVEGNGRLVEVNEDGELVKKEEE